MNTDSLPRCFCWTRYGTEAGETIEAIFARKEAERAANNGLFLWGIGNAVGRSIQALLDQTLTPKVAFSPIKSPPRIADVEPDDLIAWTAGKTLDGVCYELPRRSLVTSRLSPRRVHYALVCFSSQSLLHRKAAGMLTFSALRNLLSGRHLGASQVTAVVERVSSAEKKGHSYPISILADLHPPYFIKLVNSIELTVCRK